MVDSVVSADHRGKIKENEKKRLIHKSCQRTKEAMEHESDGYTNCNWCTWNDPQRFCKKAGGIRNRRTYEEHSSRTIVKVGQYTEKSPGDLRRLAVTQTPVKDHQLMLV